MTQKLRSRTAANKIADSTAAPSDVAARMAGLSGSLTLERRSVSLEGPLSWGNAYAAFFEERDEEAKRRLAGESVAAAVRLAREHLGADLVLKMTWGELLAWARRAYFVALLADATLRGQIAPDASKVGALISARPRGRKNEGRDADQAGIVLFAEDAIARAKANESGVAAWLANELAAIDVSFKGLSESQLSTAIARGVAGRGRVEPWSRSSVAADLAIRAGRESRRGDTEAKARRRVAGAYEQSYRRFFGKLNSDHSG